MYVYTCVCGVPYVCVFRLSGWTRLVSVALISLRVSIACENGSNEICKTLGAVEASLILIGVKSTWNQRKISGWTSRAWLPRAKSSRVGSRSCGTRIHIAIITSAPDYRDKPIPALGKISGWSKRWLINISVSSIDKKERINLNFEKDARDGNCLKTNL